MSCEISDIGGAGGTNFFESANQLLSAERKGDSSANVKTIAAGEVSSLTEGYASRFGIDAQMTSYNLRSALVSGAGNFAPANVSQADNGAPDKNYDGYLVGTGGRTYPPGAPLQSVNAIRPNPNNPNGAGNWNGQTYVYVNGITNTVGDQRGSMQAIADKTGAQVIGIHNATEGTIRDILQVGQDTLDLGNNPAVNTLSQTVYDEITNGRSIHLMAHSQGALITSRALQDVRNRLLLEDGLSASRVDRLMSNIEVETFGGASGYYPDGPQYVHYVNTADPVPVLLGLGSFDIPGAHPGRGARINRFSDQHYFTGPFGIRLAPNPFANHGINDVYLNHRVPFEQARRGNFSRP